MTTHGDVVIEYLDPRKQTKRVFQQVECIKLLSDCGPLYHHGSPAIRCTPIFLQYLHTCTYTY